MKIRPVGAELLHVGRRTEIVKLIVTSFSFLNVPKRVLDGKERQSIVSIAKSVRICLHF